MIFFGVIVSLFMHHGIAGFPPHPLHNPSERGVLVPPVAKGGAGWCGENLGLNRSYRPGGSSLFSYANRCIEWCRRRPPSQPRSGVIVKPGARAPGARCQRNSCCSFGLKPQRGDMERLAARGWHNAMSPPLGG